MKNSSSYSLLNVRLTPNSSRNEIVGWRDGVLCIKLTAPPVENAANKALLEFVAGFLQIKKNQIELVTGHKSREKTLKILGKTQEDLQNILRQFSASIG